MNEWGKLIPGSSSGSPSCRLRLEREGSLSLEQEVLVAVLLRLLSSVIVAIISLPSFLPSHRSPPCAFPPPALLPRTILTSVLLLLQRRSTSCRIASSAIHTSQVGPLARSLASRSFVRILTRFLLRPCAADVRLRGIISLLRLAWTAMQKSLWPGNVAKFGPRGPLCENF